MLLDKWINTAKRIDLRLIYLICLYIYIYIYISNRNFILFVAHGSKCFCKIVQCSNLLISKFHKHLIVFEFMIYHLHPML